MRPNVAALVRLMLVTDDRYVRGRNVVQLALAAERGGITSLQVRLKERADREVVELVRALVAALRVPVLVNDRPDIALAGGAAGVHLGPEDLSVELTRRIMPPGFIIGASVGSDSEAAGAGKADYWGVGPWRGTITKGDAGTALGAEGFGRITRLADGQPCIAIGGIIPSDISEVLRAGGSGVAVVSGILGADDVEAAARRFTASYESGE
ncbi:MAG TPA: thiamine phosphate synthase [Gemmatimonadales bacterium]|nr:thiamine phosphate synthase [Gemmatimonadales bacterium]